MNPTQSALQSALRELETEWRNLATDEQTLITLTRDELKAVIAAVEMAILAKQSAK